MGRPRRELPERGGASGTVSTARERVLTRLGDDETVIVDDTSAPRFLRDRWRALCSAAGALMVLVFIDTPDELLRQRPLNDRTTDLRDDVTDERMAGHQEGFQPPERTNAYPTGCADEQPPACRAPLTCTVALAPLAFPHHARLT